MNKVTYKDIVKFCEDNDINIDKVVTYYETWGDERDELKPMFETFEEKFGKLNQEISERTDEHDSAIVVVSIGTGDNKIYFGGYGSYASYEGMSFDYIEVREMSPYQKVVTDWTNV